MTTHIEEATSKLSTKSTFVKSTESCVFSLEFYLLQTWHMFNWKLPEEYQLKTFEAVTIAKSLSSV